MQSLYECLTTAFSERGVALPQRSETPPARIVNPIVPWRTPPHENYSHFLPNGLPGRVTGLIAHLENQGSALVYLGEEFTHGETPPQEARESVLLLAAGGVTYDIWVPRFVGKYVGVHGKVGEESLGLNANLRGSSGNAPILQTLGKLRRQRDTNWTRAAAIDLLVEAYLGSVQSSRIPHTHACSCRLILPNLFILLS